MGAREYSQDMKATGTLCVDMAMKRLSSSVTGLSKVVDVAISLGMIVLGCLGWRSLEIPGSLSFLALGVVGVWIDMKYIIPAKAVLIEGDSLVVGMAVGLVRIPFKFIFLPSIRLSGVFGKNKVLAYLESLIADIDL
jgi:hypothetical protein